MFIAAFSTQIAGWHHYLTVGGMYGAGVCLMLVATILICKSIFSTTPDKSAPAGFLLNGNNNQFAGRDAISTSERIVQAENYFENLPPSASLIPEPPSPTLLITNDVTFELIQDKGVKWRRQHDGTPMLVASVLNRNETETNKAFPANGIVVSLQFDDYEGHVRYIQRAFWIDHSENVVDIKIGKFKHFLLGFANDKYWLAYENERDTPIDPDSLESVIGGGLIPGDGSFKQRVIHRIMPTRIPITAGLRVTATVFSENTGQNFVTRTFNL